MTSAGTAAGIDACLHLVREEYGPDVATRIARRMVVPPHRHGGQRQYIDAPVLARQAPPTLQLLLEWVDEHLGETHTLRTLADRAHMSPRTFSRRFHSEIGVPPMTWLTYRRISRTQELLEATDMPIEEVARAAGFGTVTVFRHHFREHLGLPPSAYRQKFRADRTTTA